MSQPEPFLGAIVEIPAGRGVVRFCGATSFSAGKWVGIELLVPQGKNDGTVMGVTYFTCKPNHGVFVRPSQVKVVGSETQESPVSFGSVPSSI
jgi:dynactin 1